MANELLRRLEGREIPQVLDDFIDRHVGKDRQLTLRWPHKNHAANPGRFGGQGDGVGGAGGDRTGSGGRAPASAA